MSKHPMQPVEWDGHGVIRFRRNRIVETLVEKATRAGLWDLNDIAIAVARGEHSQDDMVQLSQLIGYSVSGFGDLSYPSDVVRRADRRAETLLKREPRDPAKIQ